MDAAKRKRLKQIAHHLNPVVSVGGRGLSDTLVAEIERALADHELIKIRIHSPDRAERRAVAGEIAEVCEAEIVQTIGKVCVLFKANPEPDAALSNLARHA
ncbi:MAG: ribosome assembly RNA-binding protein YhbY [Pseudomonadales bacterium]|nr:ribosome assembly RNA-binding protein YhbY [Pseudomonadales bacterium]NIX09378.1 ribosome assembly RNA-binding protein YhbY [Pseudomonadales bacterium]